MPLKKSAGNMYPWVDFTHTHLAGKCSHECSYCYVQKMGEKYENLASTYSGAVRPIEEEFSVPYGENRVIFIEHMNDMFASGVPDNLIYRILAHCKEFDRNSFVFQTKNPVRVLDFLGHFPKNCLFGTTIETNRDARVSKAPGFISRYCGICEIGRKGYETFITIEPVLQFDLDILLEYIIAAKPSFVNIGADSKNSGLAEPSRAEVDFLIDSLKKSGIEVRKKVNLERLK